jgi:hypothetical protein
MLELELTETALMHNLEGAAPLFAALKRLGVRISIDDFGTGYSSLSYLKRLPIDTLKIDRSFVRDLESSADNAAIVGAIIAMSKSLKLRVVAEGVETRGQMTRLFEQGCQMMQGFLFAPALPPQEFAQLMAQSQGSNEWRVQFGAAEPATPSAPPPPAPSAQSHSNGTHFGTLNTGAAPAARALPPIAMTPRPAPAPMAPAVAPAAVGESKDVSSDAATDSDALADEPASSEPHHARALRWARRFVMRD